MTGVGVGQINGTYTLSTRRLRKALEGGDSDQAASVLAGLSEDEAAYAMLKTMHNPKVAKLHPLGRAATISRAIKKIRKGLYGDVRYDGGNLSPDERRMANDVLGRIELVEARNAMIATGQEGWTQKTMMDPMDELEMLKLSSPRVHDDLQARLGKAKINLAQNGYAAWPAIRESLIESGGVRLYPEGGAPAKAKRKRRSDAGQKRGPYRSRKKGGGRKKSSRKRVAD